MEKVFMKRRKINMMRDNLTVIIANYCERFLINDGSKIVLLPSNKNTPITTLTYNSQNISWLNDLPDNLIHSFYNSLKRSMIFPLSNTANLMFIVPIEVNRDDAPVIFLNKIPLNLYKIELAPFLSVVSFRLGSQTYYYDTKEIGDSIYYYYERYRESLVDAVELVCVNKHNNETILDIVKDECERLLDMITNTNNEYFAPRMLPTTVPFDMCRLWSSKYGYVDVKIRVIGENKLKTKNGVNVDVEYLNNIYRYDSDIIKDINDGNLVVGTGSLAYFEVEFHALINGTPFILSIPDFKPRSSAEIKNITPDRLNHFIDIALDYDLKGDYSYCYRDGEVADVRTITIDNTAYDFKLTAKNNALITKTDTGDNIDVKTLMTVPSRELAYLTNNNNCENNPLKLVFNNEFKIDVYVNGVFKYTDNNSIKRISEFKRMPKSDLVDILLENNSLI